MLSAFGYARLGRDAELRYTNAGDAVTSLSLAFSYGRRDETGQRPTTWVDAALWGKRAESLAQYLLKGTAVVVSLDELRMETYQGRSGEGHKIAARVADIELASPKENGAAAAPPPAVVARRPEPPAGATTRPPPRLPARASAPAAGGSGFDDMDDDIPFIGLLDAAPGKFRRLRRTAF
jgi:single-strand DNA-binding protein